MTSLADAARALRRSIEAIETMREMLQLPDDVDLAIERDLPALRAILATIDANNSYIPTVDDIKPSDDGSGFPAQDHLIPSVDAPPNPSADPPEGYLKIVKRERVPFVVDPEDAASTPYGYNEGFAAAVVQMTHECDRIMGTFPGAEAHGLYNPADAKTVWDTACLRLRATVCALALPGYLEVPSGTSERAREILSKLRHVIDIEDLSGGVQDIVYALNFKQATDYLAAQIDASTAELREEIARLREALTAIAKDMATPAFISLVAKRALSPHPGTQTEETP